MAGKTTSSISWKDTLKQTSIDSGIPQKTLEESAAATVATLEKLARENRPTKLGETTVIKTPYGAIRVTLLPERTFQNPKTGEKHVRPQIYGVNIGVSKTLIDSANTGINLEKTAVKTSAAPADKKKSA